MKIWIFDVFIENIKICQLRYKTLDLLKVLYWKNKMNFIFLSLWIHLSKVPIKENVMLVVFKEETFIVVSIFSLF